MQSKCSQRGGFQVLRISLPPTSMDTGQWWWELQFKMSGGHQIGEYWTSLSLSLPYKVPWLIIHPANHSCYSWPLHHAHRYQHINSISRPGHSSLLSHTRSSGWMNLPWCRYRRFGPCTQRGRHRLIHHHYLHALDPNRVRLYALKNTSDDHKIQK